MPRDIWNVWYDFLPMSKVCNRLFVSGMAQAAHLPENNPHGITAVLCVHQDMLYHQAPGVTYIHIPFADGEEIPERQFAECLACLKLMFGDGNTILIHCAAGISRSVTICASFMHYMGIAQFDMALDEIKLARPVANPAPAVVRSAKRMLGAYPYDGSYEDTNASRHGFVKAVSDALGATAYWHSDENCPMRHFLLSAQNRSTMKMAQHEIPCTCDIGVPVFCSNCKKPPLECICFDGFQ